MKNFLIVFGVFLAWSFFALWLYSWLDPKEATAINEKSVVSEVENAEVNQETLLLDYKDEINTEETTPPASLLTENNDENIPFKGLKAIDKDGKELFNFSEGIKIHQNNSIVSMPIAKDAFLNKLKNYMNENPTQEVHINVLYSPSEDFNTPNLGVQRGEKIKELLVALAIPHEKIIIKPTIQEVTFEPDDSYPNGIYFSFKDFDPNRKVDSSFMSSLPEKIIVYPNFSEGGILVNKQLREASETVRTVLKENTNLRVLVVGHTDNVGNATDNYKAGLDYARQIRYYLLKNGDVANNRIRATSQGEAQSIATNGSERGRLLNKRIEVIFEPIN